VNEAAVGRGLLAVLHAVVAHDGGDAQVVITENCRAALPLGTAVFLGVSPLGHSRFIAPE
jgi:hypothetical protein